MVPGWTGKTTQYRYESAHVHVVISEKMVNLLIVYFKKKTFV